MSDTIQDYFDHFGPGYRWIATVTVMTAAITTVLSAAIVNVAVPQVMGSFGIGAAPVEGKDHRVKRSNPYRLWQAT